MIDLRDKVVLVTGGTRGIGLAVGLRYGRCGARVVLTHRWGSADEDELRARFAEAGAPEPLIATADVADDGDTEELLERIADDHDGVDVFVSNVSFALRTPDLDHYDRRGLLRGIEYGAWPLVAYPRAMKQRFGRWPRTVVGLSSDGPDAFYLHYDFVAASKAVLETLCRYLHARLAAEGVRVNVVRTRLVLTDAMRETFGQQFVAHVERQGVPAVSADEVADVVLALGSGLLDAVGGQVITADRGLSFVDNAMGHFAFVGGER